MLWATVSDIMEISIMASRSKQPKATSATHAPAHDQGESVAEIIAEIDGEAGDDGEEMMGVDAGLPQPSRTTPQTPATRSSPSQTTENQRKPVEKRATSRVWVTKVGHNDPSKIASTPSKQTKYSSPSWVTKVGHKRSLRGLSRRGSIYQFRVRVPVAIREEFGRSHVKRSLRTDNLSIAMKLPWKAAAEIDAIFPFQLQPAQVVRHGRRFRVANVRESQFWSQHGTSVPLPPRLHSASDCQYLRQRPIRWQEIYRKFTYALLISFWKILLNFKNSLSRLTRSIHNFLRNVMNFSHMFELDNLYALEH